MLTVAEFRTGDQIEKIRRLWTDLWSQTRLRSFYQSFEWFNAVQREFSKRESPRVFVASLAGIPVGIVPCVLRHTPSPFGIIRRLSLGTPGSSPFAGVVGSNPTATLLATMRYLRNSHRDWDMLDFQGIDVDGQDRGRIFNAMRLAGLHPQKKSSPVSSIVQINGEWQNYWKSRPQNVRVEYDCAEKRLPFLGEIRFLRYRPEEGSKQPRWDLFSSILRANAQSLFPDSKGCRRVLTRKQQRILGNAHQSAVERGAVEMNLLYVNNRPMASAYNYCCDGHVEGILLGMAADALPDAGTLLLGMMLRDSFERGDVFYRFPAGDFPAINAWATGFSRRGHLVHYPAFSMRAQLARFGEWLTGNEAAQPTPSVPELVAPLPPHQHSEVPPPKHHEFKIVG
ncbi:MAG: hypothetical protein Tsb009_07860 [Planctomycetaceae bacterium]